MALVFIVGKAGKHDVNLIANDPQHHHKQQKLAVHNSREYSGAGAQSPAIPSVHFFDLI